jgi:hypothetical protein
LEEESRYQYTLSVLPFSSFARFLVVALVMLCFPPWLRVWFCLQCCFVLKSDVKWELVLGVQPVVV